MDIRMNGLFKNTMQRLAPSTEVKEKAPILFGIGKNVSQTYLQNDRNIKTPMAKSHLNATPEDDW